jgi:hypothetical protein
MISRIKAAAIILLLTVNTAYGQETRIYQQGITAEQNLKAIVNVTPYSTGGVGFDTRYEGIKGSPRLYDTLLTSLLRINGQEDYYKLETDIDLVSNSLIFNDPKTKRLQSIPASMVSELVYRKGGNEIVFRTDKGSKFDKSLKDNKFFQVLGELPYLFIKMPIKTFTQANYKGAYSSDKRYDEYETKFRYYVMTLDGEYHKIQLTRKSLAKVFPAKKDFINNFPDDVSYKDDEELIKAIIIKL